MVAEGAATHEALPERAIGTERGAAAPAIESVGAPMSAGHPLLGLQRSHGNAAVGHVLRGLQRAPAEGGGGEHLAPAERVDRLEQGAIKLGMDKFDIDLDKTVELLSGLTPDEGREVSRIYREKTNWNLAQVISGTIEYRPEKFPQLAAMYATSDVMAFLGHATETKIGNNLGPKNRARLLALLHGTEVGHQADPAEALQAGIDFGKGIGDIAQSLGVPIDTSDLGVTVGAVGAVMVREHNRHQSAEVRQRRITAQVIAIKSWLDRDESKKLLDFLRKLASSTGQDDRGALIDEYQKQFGRALYLDIMTGLKGHDAEQAGALWLGDVVGAERVAVQAELEKYRATKASLEKVPDPGVVEGFAWGAAGVGPANALLKAKLSSKLREERDTLEAHLESLKRQKSVGTGAAKGKTMLQAVLERDRPGDSLAAELGTATATPAAGAPAPQPVLSSADQRVVGALVQGEEPVLLARRMRRADEEGHLTASEIESTLEELHRDAIVEARKRITDNPKLQDEATAKKYESDVVNSYFTYFASTFDLEDPARPLAKVLDTTGGGIAEMRDTELFKGRGVIPEWRQLDLALASDPKDYDRAKEILAHKTRSQIEKLKAEYNANAIGFFGMKRDLQTDLLGTLEYQEMLRHPEKANPELVMKTDLSKARKNYEERMSWLKGDVYEPPSAPTPESPGEDPAKGPPLMTGGRVTSLEASFSGPPVPGPDVVGNIMRRQAEKDRIGREATWLVGQIFTRYSATMDNRGTFARFHDWVGNVEHDVVTGTRDDATETFRKLDDALESDPPKFELARQLLGRLYLHRARMNYNVPVYEKATEAAFNEFVDFAVLVVSTIATAGEGGAILMAIRATAATVLTKATLKGDDYTADEFWADIRTGVISAGASKLGEKLVQRLGAAYTRSAEKLGWNRGWIGAATKAIAPAVQVEVNNLVTGELSASADALISGDPSRLAVPLSLEAQAQGFLQHGGSKLIRRGIGRVRGGRAARPTPERARPTPAPEPTPAEPATVVETGGPAITEPATTSADLAAGVDIAPAAPAGAAATAGGPAANREVGGAPAAGPGPAPSVHDIEAYFANLDESILGKANPAATLHRVQAGGVTDVGFGPGEGSRIDVRGVKGVSVHHGAVDAGGPGAPGQAADLPPETWLVDEARAQTTGPAAADTNFGPNRTGFRYDVRNAQILAGGGPEGVYTPSGPSFGGDRVVGGARGARLTPETGTWRPGEAAYQRPFNPLGQDAAFQARAAKEWFSWEQQARPLSDAERYALWFYSDDLSAHINPALRGQGAAEFVTDPIARAAVASDLDRSMQPVPFDAVVHRRASIADFADLGLSDPSQLASVVGQTYTHQGYTSTAVEAGHWAGGVEIEIQVPKGTRGRYLGGESAKASPTNPLRPGTGAPIASMPSEMEFLIERGTMFKIERAEHDPATNRWRVEVRIVEQGVRSAPLNNPVPLPGSPMTPGAGSSSVATAPPGAPTIPAGAAAATAIPNAGQAPVEPAPAGQVAQPPTATSAGSAATGGPEGTVGPAKSGPTPTTAPALEPPRTGPSALGRRGVETANRTVEDLVPEKGTIEQEVAVTKDDARRVALRQLDDAINAKPLRALTPAELRVSQRAQQRLFDIAGEAVKRMEALGHRVLGKATGKVEAMRKREDLREFVDGILEKCRRKAYERIGEMDDIIRGRINVVDGTEARRVAAEMEDQETVRTVEDPRINDAGVMRYPRSHVIVYDRESGLIFEWQIGTQATTDLYQTKGIEIPPALKAAASALGKKYKNDLHDIEYDIFQKVKTAYAEQATVPKDRYLIQDIDEFIQDTAKASERSALGSGDTALGADIADLHRRASSLLARLVQDLDADTIAKMFH
jgi:ADP-ribosyltransferase exoenzyme